LLSDLPPVPPLTFVSLSRRFISSGPLLFPPNLPFNVFSFPLVKLPTPGVSLLGHGLSVMPSPLFFFHASLLPFPRTVFSTDSPLPFSLHLRYHTFTYCSVNPPCYPLLQGFVPRPWLSHSVSSRTLNPSLGSSLFLHRSSQFSGLKLFQGSVLGFPPDPVTPLLTILERLSRGPILQEGSHFNP